MVYRGNKEKSNIQIRNIKSHVLPEIDVYKQQVPILSLQDLDSLNQRLTNHTNT